MSSPGDQQAEAKSEGSKAKRSHQVRFLVMFALVATLLGIVLWVSAITFRDLNRPETVLTLLLIIGVVTLLVTLAVMVTLLRVFDLTDPGQPLGLPEGSIRAVIALTLILVFAIMSVFIYGAMAHPWTVTSTGITGNILNLLPSDRVVGVTARTVDGETVYDVTTTIQGQMSNQLGQQLVTIVGTLVTALAAFYFGANSVKSAHAAGAATRTVTATAGTSGGETIRTTASETAPTATASSTVAPSDRVEAG